FEVKRLGIADRLDAFVREIFGEAGEYQTGTVDGWLGNHALEAVGAGGQPEFEGTGVLGVEPFDGDGVVLHGLDRAPPGAGAGPFHNATALDLEANFHPGNL